MFINLENSVGNNLTNVEEDVLAVKFGLSEAGFMDISEEPEPHGIITRDMDTGIKSFQEDKGLHVDGRLFPNGETENELFGMRLVEQRNAPVQFDATGRMIRPEAEDIKTVPVPRRKPETIASTQKGDKLLDFIGDLESSDNYNVIFGGKEKPLTKMTVKEVFELQKDMIAEGKGSSAVGRYQFLRNTLKEEVKKLGIDENALFDEKLQDQLARSRLEFRGFEKFKVGRISTEDLIGNLANEWAALPKDASNVSRHKGVLNNRALTDFKTLKDLLEKK